MYFIVHYQCYVLCVLPGLPGDYRMPFEEEVGLHPTLEEMQDAVVSSRKRPQIKQHWLKNEVICSFCVLCITVQIMSVLTMSSMQL